MASKRFSNNTFVTFAVLRSVKDDSERVFQAHINFFGEKLQKVQRQWKDLVFKVENLELELRSTKNEVSNLRSSLIKEREKWREGEESNQKLREVIMELKTECVKLEEKIVEFEEKPPPGPQAGQSPLGNDVFNLLDEFVTDTTSNFEMLNGRQDKLEEDVKVIEKFLESLTVPVPPPSFSLKSGSCKCVMVREEKSNPSSQRFASPPKLSQARSPPPSKGSEVVAVHSPPSGAIQGDDHGQVDQENRLAEGENSLSASKRDPRWDLEHGKDPTDPSKKSCLCGSSFSSKAGLSYHIFYFTQEWKFPCQFCKVRFVGYTLLRQHLRVAHDVAAIKGEEKMVGCRRCGAVLKTQLQYRNHIKLVHGKGQPSRTSKASRRRAKAKSVQFSTSNAGAVPKTANRKGRKRTSPDAVHRMDHARHLHCLCGQKFAGSTTLLGHIKYFTSQTLLCRFCDRRFAYNCYLKAHVARSHKFIAQVKQERVEIWSHE